jgi:CheY-like chemotaxis protein
VQVAGDGAQAVEAFQSWRPHFIWMDLRMPGMDGAEAVRRIRALEGGKDVKISAVTASEPTHSAMGMDDVVHKPYRVSEIFDCMARHLGVRYRPQDAVSTTFIAPPGTLRPEALATLPAELRTELTNAVLALNLNRIDAAIKRVSETDAELGAALASRASRFAFTQILEMLKECENVTF